MASAHLQTDPIDAARSPTSEQADAPEFPVREYIGAMALELAQMARWDGDEALSRLLDSAATLAAEPLMRPAIVRVENASPHPA